MADGGGPRGGDARGGGESLLARGSKRLSRLRARSRARGAAGDGAMAAETRKSARARDEDDGDARPEALAADDEEDHDEAWIAQAEEDHEEDLDDAESASAFAEAEGGAARKRRPQSRGGASLKGAQLIRAGGRASLRRDSKAAFQVFARMSSRVRKSAAQKLEKSRTFRSKVGSGQAAAAGAAADAGIGGGAAGVYTIPGGSAPTRVVAWGDNSAGQLLREGGVLAGASDQPCACAPALDSWRIVHVGTSGTHTVAVTANGELVGAGDNSEGQIDPSLGPDAFMQGPLRIADAFLQKQRVVQVACGDAHTAVLTASGHVATWGNNEAGQLGHSRDRDIYNVAPRLVERMREVVIQVACTGGSTLLLSERGRVFSFGRNLDGILGLGDEENRASPKMVRGPLDGNPIVQLAAGGSHVCAVSATGRVYSWGSNSRGQLGLARKDAPDFALAPVRVVLSRVITKVACGAEHTVFLTATSGIYVCGRADEGQLGFQPKKFKRMVTPPRRLEALGDFVDEPLQIAASHNLTVVLFDSGAVYSAGRVDIVDALQDGDRSEEGTPGHRRHSRRRSRTRHSAGHAANLSAELDLQRHGSSLEESSSDHTYSEDDADDGSERGVQLAETGVGGAELSGFTLVLGASANVVCVAAGGGASFAIQSARHTVPRREALARGWPKSAVVALSGNDLTAQAKLISSRFDKLGRKSARTFRRQVDMTLFDMCTLNASFLTGKYSSTFRSSPDKFDEKRNSCLDFASMLISMEDLAAALESSMGPDMASMYLRERLAPIIGQLDVAAPHLTEPDQLRLFLVLLLSPLLRTVPKEYDLLVGVFKRLPSRSRDILLSWIKYDVPSDLLASYLVDPLVALFDHAVVYARFDDTKEVCALLRHLHRISQGRPRDDSTMSRIDHRRFYSKRLEEMENEDLGTNFERWRRILAARQQAQNTEAFLGSRVATNSALLHEFNLFDNPFLLSAGVKRRVLHFEDQTSQLRNLLVSRLFSNEPFYTLTVRRSHLLEDTMSQIESSNGQSTEFRKPLKVKFVGEQGLDAGGVRKEFFQLLSAQLFQPDCGLFRRNGDTNTLWFNVFDEDMADASRPYLLVGILIGLAIYNSTLLDVQFPLLLWRILLGKVPEKPTLEHLEELDSSYAKNVRALLEYEDDDFEDVFIQSFEISVDIFGVRREVELVPGGSDIPVTLENRQEYVDALVKYLVVDSVGTNARDMIEGFNRVIPADAPSLRLFEPDELELAVCGTPELDFDELRRIAQYEGYDADHETVARFWHIVGSFSHDQKQKFLRFTTGSPKSPVGGLSALNVFTVQRAGPDTDQLPTSYTCFNTLMLPEYASEAKMRERLLLAMQHSIGFGLE